MMTRREIAGGSYVEAWPSGDFACLMAQSHIETSAGNVPIPPGSGLGPIYTRLYVGAGLRLAGQDQVSGNAWLWDGLRWIDRGPSYGVSPCAFGPLDGFLYVAVAGWNRGSQGIRYVQRDGAIISGDDTYADPVEKIYQFTTQGDVTIGQDQKDGVIVVYGGMRKRLVAGDTQFIRFNRSADRLAVAWWNTRENTAHMAWLNVSEIASLPDAPLVFDKPKPKPQPKPEPEPIPVSTITAPQEFVDYANRRWAEMRVTSHPVFSNPNASREALAAPASDALFQIVGEWHHIHGHRDVGLYPKTSGTNHRGFGEDIVLLKQGERVFFKDVGGAFGSHSPVLNVGGEYERSNEPEKFAVPPKPAGPIPAPPPQPGPTPQPPPSSQLEQRVAALERTLANLHVSLKGAHGKYIAIEPDGRVVADRDSVGAWEVMRVEVQP